ncbi:ABC transporter substrate-binding protein [Actinomadura macrotermitis]|uniref:ABC transporter arginine-binding protein 1 n=1 Tax=Actinomadura macrotermitis TaxID=2585200 RepID=A0A7K0BN05_9ACTN|nr:ABC transporter arginine-binding protein 1 [Actinomadura macrotermitis]
MSGRSLRQAVLRPAAAALAVVPAAGCGSGSGVTVQGAELIEKGRLTVCTSLPNPPFESVQGGRVAGFDVDLLDLVAKRLKVRLKFVQTPFETLRSGIAVGQGMCDVAAAGLPVEPARAAYIGYSDPYYNALQAVVGRKGPRYATMAAVAASGLKIGTWANSAGEESLGKTAAEPVSFTGPAALLNGLRTGRVRLAVVDHAVASGWLRDPANAGLALRGDFDIGRKYAFSVRRDENPGLLALLNSTLAQARADGSYKRIHEKWIGPPPVSR